MEDILVLILIAVVASVAKVKKNAQSKKAIQFRENYKAMQASFERQEKVNEGQQRQAEIQLEKQKHEKEQFVKNMNASAVQKQPAKEPVRSTFESAHQHEGRQDIPCPAVERELPRIQAKKEEKKPAATVPGLKLQFDQNAVLQGFVMSEILNRPRSGARR